MAADARDNIIVSKVPNANDVAVYLSTLDLASSAVVALPYLPAAVTGAVLVAALGGAAGPKQLGLGYPDLENSSKFATLACFWPRDTNADSLAEPTCVCSWTACVAYGITGNTGGFVLSKQQNPIAAVAVAGCVLHGLLLML